MEINLEEYLEHTGFTTPSGKGVGIAIIDTGCNLKNDKIVYTYNGFTGTTDVTDPKGHGTTITDIIHRIAPESNLYIMKGLDDYGSGDMLSVYNCLARCRDIEDIDLICMSFSSYKNLSQTTQNALNGCLKEGKLMFASIGNDNKKTPTYPSSIEGVYKVGALNADLTGKEKESNFFTYTSFVALGENIDSLGETYHGTSFANAIVVAQVANIMSDNQLSRQETTYEYLKKHFREKNRKLETAFGSLYKEETHVEDLQTTNRIDRFEGKESKERSADQSFL